MKAMTLTIFRLFLSGLLLACLLGISARTLAIEPLVIVADPWPPYTIEKDGMISGTDVEIIEAIFSQLEIPITVKIMPWARCLALVKNKQADAILDASISAERKTFLHFPTEPVSQGTTVFFVRKNSTLPYENLASLNDLRAGAILGYNYCPEIDDAAFMKRAERVTKLDQIFNMLLLKRIDFVIEVDAVGYFVAKEMGISDQIATIPGAKFCHGGNYLAFAKKAGHEALAGKFSEALRSFKETENYRQILRKYGDIRSPANASN